MLNLRIIAFVIMWFASMTGCSESNDVKSNGEVGGLVFVIPQEFWVADNSSFLTPDSNELDEQSELLIKLPLSELDLDDPTLQQSRELPEVMVRLVSSATSKNNIATDAQHAWLGTGLYQERVIENDAEVGLTRIYPKSGYPLIWNYFRSSPTKSPSKALMEDQWVASCRLQPHATEYSVNRAQCNSKFIWKSIQVELAFPGTLVGKFTEFSEVVRKRLNSWAVRSEN